MSQSFRVLRRAARAAALVTLSIVPQLARAQDTTARPAPIQDNSFLIEEAYNQERGVVQHISTFMHQSTGQAWAYSFTQEWPAPSQRHQLSYTVPILQIARARSTRAIGDVAVNYRYQLLGMHGERVAIAPRLTAMLPTGDADDGSGAGGFGVQGNLPVSIELGDRLVTHANAGVTLTPRARAGGATAVRTTSYNLGQSVIWLAAQRVNLMLEASWASIESANGAGGADRESQLLLSPGIRWAYDLANGTQLVPGIAVPIGVGPSRGNEFLFLYFSVEHPF